jgi:hypothetical protein
MKLQNFASLHNFIIYHRFTFSQHAERLDCNGACEHKDADEIIN